MRKVMAVVSVVFGILTFAAVAYAGRQGSNFNAALTSIPAFICILAAIAGDKADGQHLDLDEVDIDA